MTQHGSFPDRPRGRRARHGSDSQWQSSPEGENPGIPGGHDAIPQDEREFPDLEPIRGRHGRHSVPGAGSVPYAGQSYAGQSYAGQAYAGQPSAAAPDARQPYREEQAATRVTAGGGSRARSQAADDLDEISDDPMEAFSRRWERRGAEDGSGGGRSRKLMWLTGGGVIVVAVAVVAYFLFSPGSGSSSVGFGSLVTTFLPGEIQTVPDACSAVSSATLSEYLSGGQPDIAAPPLNGGADSQCTWTLDSPPTYRVIEVDVSAFSPSALATSDGSATFAAIDAYASDLRTMKTPAASSGQPAVTITDIAGLGTAAFSATQIFNVNGTTTYKATIIARYHNVIVTAVVNGLDHAVTKKGSYGPVAMSTLSAAAQQVATEAVAHLHS